MALAMRNLDSVPITVGGADLGHSEVRKPAEWVEIDSQAVLDQINSGTKPGQAIHARVNSGILEVATLTKTSGGLAQIDPIPLESARRLDVILQSDAQGKVTIPEPDVATTNTPDDLEKGSPDDKGSPGRKKK